jgi:hypothetical protein
MNQRPLLGRPLNTRYPLANGFLLRCVLSLHSCGGKRFPTFYPEYLPE